MEGIESMSGKFDEIMQRALKRETEKVREESLKKGEADGLKKGRLEGEANGLRKAAKSMLEDGSIPIPKIAEFSGLTIGEVESIRSSINA